MNKLSPEMDMDELYSIATAVLKNKIREDLEKNKRFWLKLKISGQINRELRNLEIATGIPPQKMRNFGAIVLAKDAPEIFGAPERQMTEMEMGDISYTILMSHARQKGFRVLSENQERRQLGNIAAATGIKIERLKLFGNIFLKAAIDCIYNIPIKSSCVDCIESLLKKCKESGNK